MPNLYTIKSIALAAAIVVVLNIFFNIGLRTFYPSPQYEDFCPHERGSVRYTDKTSCEAIGGFWHEPDQLVDKVSPRAVTPEEQTGWCDSYFTCQKEFNSTHEVYERNAFIILIIAGAVALGIGYAISASPAVSAGFIFGGVLSFIIGTIRYWSAMDDYLRFIILGIVLAALVWIGYRKLGSRV